MVNLEDIPVDAAISWTEQVLLNDSWVAKLSAVNSILAKQHNHTASDVTDLQALLDNKVTKNANITWATKTKITYDAKWLVTAGADAGISDISWLQSALDAKASLAGATFSGDIVVPAEAYWTWWNGSNEAPTKNDVYDKIETITSGQRTKITKATTTQRTSTTTMASDPELTFNMAANTKYTVRGFVIFEANTATDIKIWYTSPSSPTLAKISRRHFAPTTPTSQTSATDEINTVTTITCSTWVYWFLYFTWFVHNWANTWAFAVQWAQNTSDVAVTQVIAGSYIEYTSF